MPTYDYECNGCGHKFELFQSINAAVETDCPKCHEAKLRRLIGSGAAVVFKGSGFYQTDYRSDGYKKSAKADGKSTEGGGESKSTESKSADSAASTTSASDTAGASQASSASSSSESKSSSPKKTD